MSLNVYISGQRSFGAAVAELVIDTGHRLVGVASPAEHPNGGPDPLHSAAFRHHVPWTDAALFTSEHVPTNTDVIIAAHSHAIIGPRTRARARVAAIGYHPSLLPLHRGRDAVRWTVRDGDRVAGGSVYHLTNRVDGGPLAAQAHTLVPRGITASELWRDRLFPLGLDLLTRVLDQLDNGIDVRVPQDEALATWEPSWERPPLHRPELLELPAPGTPRPRYRVTSDAL